MMLRVRQWDENENRNKLLSIEYLKDSDVSETFKILHYMKQNEIPLRITQGVADSDNYEEYFIDEISMEFDEMSKDEILPCMAVNCL